MMYMLLFSTHSALLLPTPPTQRTLYAAACAADDQMSFAYRRVSRQPRMSIDPVSARSSVADVIERVTPSVALLTPRGVRNSSAQGSAFAVSTGGRTLLLTNAHVAAGGASLEVRLPADDFATPLRATVVGRAPGGEDLGASR
jgi:S1-C subfamily serine protease